MELRGMNDRIKKLRKQSEETTPHIFMERAMLMTDAYKKYEGEVSIPELRALSMKEIFSRKTITIEDGELIVGDKGAGPQSTPTFPELCCHTLEDMKVMNDRELICFKVSDEDMKRCAKGMKKINVGTELNKSYIEEVNASFPDATPLTSLRKLFTPANDHIKRIITEKSTLFKI